jgi:phosphate transport system ATP-binding protein
MRKTPSLTPTHLGPTPSHDRCHATKVEVKEVSFWYGEKLALDRISLDIYVNEVTAFLGASGCGKTTLLRCMNRTSELIPSTRLEDRILLDGQDMYDEQVDPPLVRRRFGWVAQRPNPFPRSIRDNILYGPKLQGLVDGREDEEVLVERVLRSAGLLDKVRNRLRADAIDLSTGQQQRLCIARALATDPDVILMDEPCSAPDPITTALVEELIDHLRSAHTLVIIIHSIQQAGRISQRIAFFHLGQLLEVGDTEQIILNPKNQRCSDFITGRFG